MAKYLNLAGLQTLWAKIKNTFLSKDSPAGQIFEFPYLSTDYSLEDLNQLASEGKAIRCVLPNGIRLTLYYIGPGPENIDVAQFIGPCIPDSSGGSAYTATMNSNKEWTDDTTHSQYSWSNLIGNQPAPIAHSHDARDIKSGILPDTRIASAATWNGKMDNDGSNASEYAIGNQVTKAAYYASIPTGLGDVQFGVALRNATTGTTASARFDLLALEARLQSDIASWGKAEEVFDESDGGRLLFLNVPNGSVIRIKNPSQNSGLASLLVQATANGGWPLVFQVGWRMHSSGSYSASPKVAFLYSTNHSSDNKMATVKTGSGDRYIYVAINRTDETTRRVMLSLHADYVHNFEIDIVSETASAYQNATKVSNIEGCVIKENIGTAIGGTFQPVYVNEAGFVNACLFKLSINVLSTEQSTISFV